MLITEASIQQICTHSIPVGEKPAKQSYGPHFIGKEIDAQNWLIYEDHTVSVQASLVV